MISRESVEKPKTRQRTMHEPKPKPRPDKPLGRPKREFTVEQIELIDEHALHNCKDNQIATLIGISSNTFKQHFGERCKQKRAEGQAVKMKQQYDDKTPTMLIWWGKQHLEQTDRQELTGKDGEALEINVKYVKVKAKLKG